MNRSLTLTLLGTAVAFCSVEMVAFQQAERPKVRLIQHIKDNLYWIPGGEVRDRATWTGGNTAVFVTSQGVVLVDTMFSGSGAGIIEQVKTVTDKPITTIIHTHPHLDHTGGDQDFPNSVEFVAQENTKSDMAALPAFQGDKAKVLARKTFKDRMSMFEGKDRIDLYFLGKGHTDGDTWVVFPALGVMHTGDIVSRKAMPVCDVLASHGSCVENDQTLRNALRTIKGVNTIIGGHAQTLMSWADLEEYADFYSEFVNNAKAAREAGKSVDEAAAAYKPSDRFKAYEIDPARVKTNTQLIFAELQK